ncbi:MAG: lipopolysaccharide biosynthesis protein [Saprospiraceae bacterium]
MLKKLASETAIYGTSSILSRLLNYVILTPYLTTVFLKGQYGVVSEMYVYAGLLMVLFTYRMETTFFRFGNLAENRERVFSTAMWSLIVSTFSLVVILLLFSQNLANLLEYPDNRDYVIWFIFIIAFDALAAILFARLRLENRPIRFAILKTLGIIVNIFFIFFFLEICPWLIEQGFSSIKDFFHEENRITYIFVANLIGSASVLLLMLPEFRHLRFTFDNDLWKKMMWYAAPLVIVGLASVINQLISLPLIKFLLPYSDKVNMEQVGIYGACYKIAILMSLFTQAFNYAAEPFFFRNADRSDAKETYAQVAQAFTLVGCFAFLGIMSYIDIVRYFINDKFWEGLSIVPILLIAFLMLGIYYNFSIWYKLTDRTKFGAYISLTGVAITLVLNFLLIPRIGYIGGAWGALACYSSMVVLSYVLGQKYFPVDYPIGKMILYIGSSVLVYFISNTLATAMEWTLVIKLIVNTLLLLSWAGGIYLLDIKNLKAMLK